MKKRAGSIAGKLDGINLTLKGQNACLRQMLDVMSRPENKFVSTLQTVVLIVGAFGFINLGRCNSPVDRRLAMLVQFITSLGIVVLSITAFFMLQHMKKHGFKPDQKK